MGEDIDDRVAKAAPAQAAGSISLPGLVNGETVLTTKTIAASLAELGYCDGVTSAIQTQLDGKAAANAIINGCFRVAQRGTSFTAATTPANSDDTYLLDRWVLLSDGNDIVDVSQTTTVIPSGSYAAAKLEVETANKQFGFLQILEARDAAKFIGQTVSLSFKARMAAADDNTHSLKAVILSWSSTADDVTSDVVDAWGATPTYVANWTAENTPESKTLTTSYQTFKVEGVSIDTANAVNVAVFIFCDQTDGVVDDAVYITDIQLEVGAVATPFVLRQIGSEFALCCRYFEKLVDPINWYGIFGLGLSISTVAAEVITYFSEKRTRPSVTYGGGDGHFTAWESGGNHVGSSIEANIMTTKLIRTQIVTTGLTQYRSCTLHQYGDNSAYIDLSAEL